MGKRRPQRERKGGLRNGVRLSWGEVPGPMGKGVRGGLPSSVFGGKKKKNGGLVDDSRDRKRKGE